MAHKKRRVAPHIMEDQSRIVVRRALPKEWVIRDHRPDYGIDISVEIFNPIDGSESITETSGEWFFAQIKSVNKTSIRRRKVYPRYNVEKGPLNIDKEDKDNFVAIDTMPCRIDTDTLLTIQSLGSGVPVLLFLVTLDTEKLYFVCMNDVIDKCILPEDGKLGEHEEKTIHIQL